MRGSRRRADGYHQICSFDECTAASRSRSRMPPVARPYHSVMTSPRNPPPASDPIVVAEVLPGPLCQTEPIGHRGESGLDGGGGACTFEGITRPEHHPDHGDLLALRYEVAEPITSSRLRELAGTVASRHGLRRIEIRHASGEVAIGQVSVRIITVADHRDAAFTACREAIDRLKVEIPIWKQERWQDGTTWSDATSPLPETLAGGTE